MPQYRLYLMSPGQAILAREDFLARDDQTAIGIATEVCEACSDMCSGYMLWRGSHRVIEQQSAREGAPAGKLYGQIEAQQTLLEIEDSLQSSGWRVANSRKLLTSARRLRHDVASVRKAS